MTLRVLLLLFLFLWGSFFAFTDTPDWIDALPYDEEYFYGIGKGESESSARALALVDIKMQLSTKVNSVVIVGSGESGKGLKETIDFAVNSNSLRGAETEDIYEENGTVWALMKYCDECSKILLNSILTTLENNYDLDKTEVMEKYARGTSSKAVKLKRMLDDIKLDDFNTQDITVVRNEKSIIVRVSRFLPNSEELTSSQKEGLSILAGVLLNRLTSFDYSHITIIGHANPTGLTDEETELENLSRMRAETMNEYLSLAGLNVTDVDWRGGRDTIGNGQTEEGKALNRRVELNIYFKEGL